MHSSVKSDRLLLHPFLVFLLTISQQLIKKPSPVWSTDVDFAKLDLIRSYYVLNVTIRVEVKFRIKKYSLYKVYKESGKEAEACARTCALRLRLRRSASIFR